MQFTPSAHKLSNGLVVLLDPMDIATTGISVSVGVGSRDETPNELGITHFIEHMLINGTPRFPSPKSIRNYVEDNGGKMNAGTGNERIQIFGRILEENSGILLDLFADLLNNSLFDKKALDRERTVIIDEYRRSLDDHDHVFYYFSVQHLFRDSGLAHMTLGTPENIAAFTREQMIDYLRCHFSAKNTIIGISGKIEDPVATLTQAENLFGKIPIIDVPDNSTAAVHPTITHNPRRQQKNVNIRICFEDLIPSTLENRFRDMCAGRFRMALRRRLFENVRNKHGLVYGISIDGLGNDAASVFSINTESAPENIEKVVAVIAQTCKDIMGPKPFTQEELDRQKMVLKFGKANWLESAEQRRDKLISFWRRYGLPYDFYADLEMNAKTTVADVLENSRDAFTPPVSIITQGPEFKADLKRIWEDNFN